MRRGGMYVALALLGAAVACRQNQSGGDPAKHYENKQAPQSSGGANGGQGQQTSGVASGGAGDNGDGAAPNLANSTSQPDEKSAPPSPGKAAHDKDTPDQKSGRSNDQPQR